MGAAVQQAKSRQHLMVHQHINLPYQSALFNHQSLESNLFAHCSFPYVRNSVYSCYHRCCTFTAYLKDQGCTGHALEAYLGQARLCRAEVLQHIGDMPGLKVGFYAALS